MIDTHAHINSNTLKIFKEEIIQINNLAYLDKIINVGTDSKTNKEVLKIAASFKKFYVSLGVHPLYEGNIEDILKLIPNKEALEKVVAIGETGLDASSELEPQKRKFIESIELANYLRLPIIIHANNTNKLVINLLNDHPPHYGFVFHCFQPDLLILEKIQKKDGYISVGIPITKKTAKKSLEVVKSVSLDHLLIETDYPFMSRYPTTEGKLIFKKIQELRNLDFEETKTILDSNAKRLFYKLDK